MGPMVRGRPLDRKRVARWSAVAIVALFLWSFIAAPSAQTQETDVTEPSSLGAYDATADATPLTTLVDHQVALIQLPPTIAHSASEVSLPSQANSIAYILDNGLANGLHGTTTGNKVPTEVTASQPGGNEKDEWVLAEQSLGNDDFGKVGAGVARATAEHSVKPRGFAHAYLGNLVLLPAPGSPDQPPGTYDPANDQSREQENPGTFPVPSGSPTPEDDPRAYTPNPNGQMAILAVGSVASTSESFREDGKVVSIAVAEINGINLGNRTGDNRCTNCITIDSVRIEARAESDGTKEGALAAWRLLIHRACRVSAANDAAGNSYEAVKCLDPNPDKIIEVVSNDHSAEAFEDSFTDTNANGVRRVKSLDALNEMFAKGLGSGSMSTGDLGLRMIFGKGGSATVTQNGQQAAANAAGLEFEVTTAAQTHVLGMFANSAQPVVAPLDKECQDNVPSGINLPNGSSETFPEAIPCPNGIVDKAATLRSVRFTLGRVAVSAVARPGSGAVDLGGTTTPGSPSFNIPSVSIPSFNIPAQSGGGNNYVVGGGIGSGPLRLRVNWASVRIKPWKPLDMTKGILGAALLLGLVVLVRRRLRALGT
jgi:hypothetical protein